MSYPKAEGAQSVHYDMWHETLVAQFKHAVRNKINVDGKTQLMLRLGYTEVQLDDFTEEVNNETS